VTGNDESEVQRMEHRQHDTTEHDHGGSRSAADLGWARLQSAVDEAEVQSFPASDPQSSWAGPDLVGRP
jgi:hypothetical protein